MNRLKSLLRIFGLLLLITAFEIFRNLTGVRLTLIDLILNPLILLFIYALLRYDIFNKETLYRYNLPGPVSLSKKIGILSGSLIMVLLGSWSFISGIREPMVFFSGVKGAVHGYTLAVMGICMLLLGGYGTVKSLLILFWKK